MSKKSGIGKFIFGLGLGIGAGMLLAPKKGEELRKDLKEKLNDLLNKAKEIDLNEVKEDFMIKVNELKNEIEDLDKEKVLELAREKGELLKDKANQLLVMAKEKGTPVLEKAARDVKDKAILVTKDVLRKLEQSNNKAESK